jgi:hypothetical protein
MTSWRIVKIVILKSEPDANGRLERFSQRKLVSEPD